MRHLLIKFSIAISIEIMFMRAHIFTPRGILLKMHKDSIFKEMKKGAGIFTLKKWLRTTGLGTVKVAYNSVSQVGSPS